jgi:hypothetical protein
MLPTVSAAATRSANVLVSETLAGDLERWAAWQERGRQHDLRVRRRFSVAVPTILIVAAIAYALLSR